MDQGEDEADDHGDEADAEEDEEDGEEGLHNPIDKDTIIFLLEQAARASWQSKLAKQAGERGQPKTLRRKGAKREHDWT